LRECKSENRASSWIVVGLEPTTVRLYDNPANTNIAAIASAMTLFDPDLSWAQIDIVQQ